jgi:hypothetical protein
VNACTNLFQSLEIVPIRRTESNIGIVSQNTLPFHLRAHERAADAGTGRQNVILNTITSPSFVIQNPSTYSGFAHCLVALDWLQASEPAATERVPVLAGMGNEPDEERQNVHLLICAKTATVETCLATRWSSEPQKLLEPVREDILATRVRSPRHRRHRPRA